MWWMTSSLLERRECLMRYVLIVLLLVSTLGCNARQGGPADAEQAPEVRVMSFNIRYPNQRDGDDYWPHRKQLVVDTINDFGPDVLGVQEALLEQAEYLDDALAGYTRIGVGRDDGKNQGEMTAVYFREARFSLIDHGHFWLSDTPEDVASVGWDAALARMATWLALEDKASGRRVVLLNTHFDHRGSRAREQSAKLIRRRLARLSRAFDASAILIGDFNADAPDSAPFAALMAEGEPKLVDTYTATHAGSTEPDGTFNGFRGETSGPRIDWIVVTDEIQIIDAAIDRSNDNGRYPSDHYPVTAVLRLAP